MQYFGVNISVTIFFSLHTIQGMFNTSELILHWENKSPVTFAPELHLTEYVLLNMWTNESTVNADLSDLRHGAFGKLFGKTFFVCENLKIKMFHSSW